MTKFLNTRILLSGATILAAGAVIAAATFAFFSDTETSAGNTFAAGEIDLLVDSESHYAGLVCNEEGVWEVEDNVEGTTREDLIGDDCDGTWTLTDLGPTNRFFNFGDLKPGDEGENTLSIHVENNDAFVCAVVNNLEDNENSVTEPEDDLGDTGPEGELSNELRFFAWADTGVDGVFDGENPDVGEGDNIWQANEEALFSNEEGPASDVLGGVSYPLFTPVNGALPPGDTAYVGVYWCYGDITVGDGTLSCDGEVVSNDTQTDSMTADISFYVEQARDNEDFTCPTPEEIEPDNNNEGTDEVGAFLGAYSAPIECNVTVEDDETIQSGVDEATVGQTVCVEDGTYNETVDITTEGLTLASLTGPENSATINGGVIIDAANVKVSGFVVIPGNTEGSTAGFYLKEPADNAEISFNEIDGDGVVGGPRGILNVIGTDLPGVLIHNNYIHDLSSGIYTNPHTGMWTIEFNDIDNNGAGIGQWNGANILNNEFEHSTPNSEAIGVDSSWDSNGGSANFNNFLDGTKLITYDPDVTGIIDAEDNFFNNGGATQVDETNGDVDFDPEAVSAFDHQ